MLYSYTHIQSQNKIKATQPLFLLQFFTAQGRMSGEQETASPYTVSLMVD